MHKSIPLEYLIIVNAACGSINDNIAGNEASKIYNFYFSDSQKYDISLGNDELSLYVSGNLGLFCTGIGKVNSALNLNALLSDSRFDFSKCSFIVCACCGSAYGVSVPGDVILITGVCDIDLGYHVDSKDKNQDELLWYRAEHLFDNCYFDLSDNEIVAHAWDVVKSIGLDCSQQASAFMANTFKDEAWALRKPKVIKGSAVCSDQYWKGRTISRMAHDVVCSYGLKDVYAATDVEDISTATVLYKWGYLSNLLILRYSVNMDVFMGKQNPTSLWDKHSMSWNTEGFDDIFNVASSNCLKILECILNSYN